MCFNFSSNPILLNVCFPVQSAHRNFVLQPLNIASILPPWFKFWNKWDLYLYTTRFWNHFLRNPYSRILYRYKSHLFQNLHHCGMHYLKVIEQNSDELIGRENRHSTKWDCFKKWNKFPFSFSSWFLKLKKNAWYAKSQIAV